MSEAVFQRESAMAFFKELVADALAHQQIAAGELTEFYIVNLLAAFLQRPAGDVEPLALQLARALESGGMQQRATLKQIGDLSLFVSGFFSDSLRRKLVDIDYYVQNGGYAYGSLGRYEGDTFSPAFAELGQKFVAFVDVLNEVSERTSCSSNSDLLRLYEKWLQTGSRRSGQLLVERGVLPTAAAKSRFVQ